MRAHGASGFAIRLGRSSGARPSGESGLLFADTHFWYGARDFSQSFWPSFISELRVAADPKNAVNGTRKNTPAKPWDIEDSLDLYNVNAWGKGYFSINDAGHVIVRPDTQGSNVIDLFEVVEGLKARDLTTPVVVRFS